MSNPELRQAFLQEAQELLEQLEQTLLDLSNTPDDAALVDTAFRALHTIKGSGSMFGFEAAAAFVHHVETAFDLVRTGKARLTRDLLSVALAARDHVRILIEQPDSARPETGAALLEDLRRAIAAQDGASGHAAPEHTAGDRAAGNQAKTEAASADTARADPGEATWRIRMRLPNDAMANGTNPLLLLDELRTLGSAHVVAQVGDVPKLEEMDPASCYLKWEITLRTRQSHAAIEQVFIFVLDEMQLEIEQIAGAPPPAVPAQTPRPADAEPVPAAPPAPAAEKPPAQAAEPTAQAKNTGTSASIRVPAERLDELMDRVGELVIAQSRLKQIAAASDDVAVKSVAEEIERLALELRDSTMGVRMLPIGSLFGKFRRLIHDLARDLGKKIELVTHGEDTELDKTVIERLNDPLVHLIRNAVDHGLENPEGRAAAGKSAFGRITLSAQHSGAEVLVAIDDDGRGLDRVRIRARAEENGLVVPGANLTDNELFNCIFLPGFSTAREVTSLSGRGVGMDVVKRAIESLRGTIDISSRPGQGSRITLRLPLTLAIIDGLLVRIGHGRYVIPLSAVEECVELSAEEDVRSRGRSFLNIRGDLVPFLRLREMFNASTQPDRFQKVVVVSAGDLRVGLVVDQVIGDHQTVIKSLSKLHSDVDIFSGATILGDGTVALIFDVAHLVETGQRLEDRLKIAS
jgi:two-component system chemotaxis sensor kinase CheA